jgi:hypothetical protein
MLLPDDPPTEPQTPTQKELALLQNRITLTPGSLRDLYSEKLLKGDATEEHVACLEWLVKLGREKNLSLAGLARIAEIHDGTISKLFSASYPAKLDSICERIGEFRNLWEQRQAITRTTSSRPPSPGCSARRAIPRSSTRPFFPSMATPSSARPPGWRKSRARTDSGACTTSACPPKGTCTSSSWP